MGRVAGSLFWTALVFVGLWYCPYGMPHHAPVGAYIAFAALIFAAAWCISVAAWTTRASQDIVAEPDVGTS